MHEDKINFCQPLD